MKTKQVISIVLLCLITSFLYAQQPKLKELKGDDLQGTILPAEKKGKWGYVNAKGKFLIKPVFDSAMPYDNMFAIVKCNDKYGVIDRAANYKLTPLYDKISKYILCGGECNYMVEINGKKGLTDDKFNILLEPTTYIDIAPFCSDNKNFFVCNTGDKKVFYSHNPLFPQFPPSQYDDIIWSKNDSCFFLRNDSLYGYTTGDFSFIVEPCFNFKPDFSSGPIKSFNDLQEPIILTRKGICTIEEYDSIQFNTLNYKEYTRDKTIPIWAKKHIKAKTVKNAVVCRVNSSNPIHEVNNGIGQKFILEDGTKLYFPTKIKEQDGGNELWHNVVNVSWFDDKILCFFRDYNTNDSKMQIFQYAKTLDSFYGKLLDDYYIGDLYTKKGEAVLFKPLINDVLRKYENLTDNYTVFPTRFCSLNNGNSVITFRIRYNGRDNVIGYGTPQYRTIMGQLVLVNDGVYTERNYDFLEIALIVNKNGSVINCLHLPDYRNNQILLDRMGGFFCVGIEGGLHPHSMFGRQEGIVINHDSPILKFNNDGDLEWRYTPSEGQHLYDIDGNVDNIFLVGKTTSQGIIGHDNSLFITLDNKGVQQDMVYEKGKPPYKKIRIYNDNNLYVYNNYLNAEEQLLKQLALPKLGCKWAAWANSSIGGCGLYDETRQIWIINPVLSNCGPITKDGYTIYPFEGDKAKVIKDSKTIYVDKNGKILNE
jgi:hypothetical protein